MSEIATVDEQLLAHQFDDLEQQHDSSMLGMWAFLATEVMFFGGLFTGYIVYRLSYPEAFIEGSRHLNVTLGAINTAVLLCSSLAMAMAVRAAQLRRHDQVVGYLVLTLVLGTAFLGIKAYEWYVDYQEHLVPGFGFQYHRSLPEGVTVSQVQMFFVLYFFMTGLHALHMVVGIVLVGVTAFLVWRRWFSGAGETQVEVVGLYWHFIDIVWVFLYPLLYLIDVHK